MTEFGKSPEDCVATPLAIAVSRILRASVSRAAELRRSERTRFFVCERRRSRRVPDVRAADLQEEMAEQRFSVLSAPTKTAATQRTSQRAGRAIKYSAMREQRDQ